MSAATYYRIEAYFNGTWEPVDGDGCPEVARDMYERFLAARPDVPCQLLAVLASYLPQEDHPFIRGPGAQP